jgi:hypothetical protein
VFELLDRSSIKNQNYGGVHSTAASLIGMDRFSGGRGRKRSSLACTSEIGPDRHCHVLTPQDRGLNAISINHLFRDMMRGRARRKAKNFFRRFLLFIVCCVWVLFWFDVLMSITNDPDYLWISPEQAFLQVTLCMLTMAVVPFGFAAARLMLWRTPAPLQGLM